MAQADTIFNQRVTVWIGDILNTTADAVVNSTDPQLTHELGQVSRVLLNRLGNSLTDQCRQRYPGGIEVGKVAVTDAFDLSQFKHIFHIAPLQQIWNVCDDKKLLKALRKNVEACLEQASTMGLSSLVFPALATGTLQYPPDLEARTVLETTRHFLHNTPHTSLTSVTFVTYMGNPDVAKKFKAEETIQRYCPQIHHLPDGGKVERRFQVSKVLVQVVQGDALTRRCTADLLICANPPATGTLEDYMQQMVPGCSDAIVDVNYVKNEIEHQLRNTPVTSVQLNMQTFDAKHLDSIVEGIKKASAQTVLVIVIVVSSTDVFNRLCTKFESGPPYEAVDQRAENQMTWSFMQPHPPPSGRGQAVVPPFPTLPVYNPTSSQQAGGAVTLSLPREQLKGVDLNNLMDEFDKLKVSVSFGGGQVKFRAKSQNLDQLRQCVQNTIGTVVPPAPTMKARKSATGSGASAVPNDERQFRTEKGLKVSVYTGNITVAQVDAIVSAAHERLSHQGGVAAAIATAAGPELRDESSEHIAQNGPLTVRDVIVTTAGELPCQHVLHALGPRWADYGDKMLCQQHLTDTVFYCLMKAHSLKLTSLAVCSISSGVFGVPKQVCAKSYLEAVLNFEGIYGDDTRLQNIHFVDINDDMVKAIHNSFATHWRTE